MSVNPHHNGQKFTDKSPENVGLSVKCVLITDKCSKNGSLSVNFSEILADCPKNKKYPTIIRLLCLTIIGHFNHGTDFYNYSVAYGVMGVRLHTFIIMFQLAFPLVPSTLARARRAYPSQARLGYAGAERVRFRTLLNQVSPHIPPIASKDSLDETSSPSVAQSLRTGS